AFGDEGAACANQPEGQRRSAALSAPPRGVIGPDRAGIEVAAKVAPCGRATEGRSAALGERWLRPRGERAAPAPLASGRPRSPWTGRCATEGGYPQQRLLKPRPTGREATPNAGEWREVVSSRNATAFTVAQPTSPVCASTRFQGREATAFQGRASGRFPRPRS